MKVKYCSMVSFGGVVTGKSSIQREKRGERKKINLRVKLMSGKFGKE